MTQLRHIPYSIAGAARNMALDATMLSECHSKDLAMWRFYGWDEPAITFGYSQQWDWVQRQVHSFNGACIRRLTGGGIVDHRQDLTYALAIPAMHPLHRQPAREIYKNLHQGIADAMNSIGIVAELAPCPGPCSQGSEKPTGVCFQSPEPFDVLSPGSGMKLAGAAMKRNKLGILVQGSISREAIIQPGQEQFIDSIGIFLEVWLGCGKSAPADAMPPEPIAREESRFGSSDWNQRR